MLIKTANGSFEFEYRNGGVFFRLPYVGQGYVSRADTCFDWHWGYWGV